MNLQSNCSQTSIYAIAQRCNRVNRAMNLVRLMKLHIISRSLKVITYYVLKIIFYHEDYELFNKLYVLAIHRDEKKQSD